MLRARFDLRRPELVGGCTSSKHPGRAQVLVYVRPMDAEPAAGDLPVRALPRRRAQKARIPCEWNGNCAAVDEIDADMVLGDPGVPHALTGIVF